MTRAREVLIIYATAHGHTAKVAGRVAEVLRERGLGVDLRDVARPGDREPELWDAVIAAASIHRGHHQREMVDWVKTHLAELARRPSAFLSVSLTAADDAEEAREATRRCIDDFLEETGWTPDRSLAVAGALQYLEYDVFTRTLMRMLMRRGGHATDASQDHVYTDWAAVEASAREFAALVATTAPAG